MTALFVLNLDCFSGRISPHNQWQQNSCQKSKSKKSMYLEITQPFFMLMVSVANIRGSQSIRHFGCFCNNFCGLNLMAIISIWSQVISWWWGNQDSIFCHWIVWSVTSSSHVFTNPESTKSAYFPLNLLFVLICS